MLVRIPYEDGWDKLVCMLNYLKHNKNDRLTLEVDDSRDENWHLDAFLAVNPDMKSHTGISSTFGETFPINISLK